MIPLMLILALSSSPPPARADSPALTAAADSLGALIGPPSSRFT